MNWTRRSCQRFRQLADEANDRDLTPQETQFCDSHREACADCREIETEGAMALNMLRSFAEIEPEVDHGLTDRIVRRARIQTIRSGLRFWSPALGGMVIGALMMMAVVQLVGRSNVLPRNHNNQGDARRIERSNTAFPDLHLTPQ